MKVILTIRPWVLGVAAICAAAGSDALTLGRARGGALLGQPLEISVSVQTAADESVSAECFEADVYYGDNRQEAGRVRVNAEAAAPGQPMAVRVSSYAPVDEPVVTVYFRGGCGQKTTRKYVLLADMASEPAVPNPAPAAPVLRVATPVAVASKPVPIAPVGQAAASGADSNQSATDKKPRQPAVAVAPKNTLRSSDRPMKQSPAEPIAKRPRLKLAAVDLVERDPVLRLSNELLSSPQEDLQKRAEAVALWRSLNMSAQDVLNEQSRTLALDADVKALRDQTARNQAALAELVERLERAEAQRYSNPLVYGLFALLVAVLAGLAWSWRRLREANVDPYPWWSSSNEADATTAAPRNPGIDHVQSPVTRTGSTGTVAHKLGDSVVPAQVQHGVQSVDIDIDLEMGPSVFSPPVDLAERASTPGKSPQTSRGAQEGTRDFAHSVAGTLRAINSHELLDVRQQADFFMTLGQYEDAIELLEASIRDSGESNPLVYLDLLKIFHTLSRKEDYDRVRNEFNDLFTGVVPEYHRFNHAGRCLEEYPEICAEVCAAWNTASSLEVIERYLVRTQDHGMPLQLDLEAYRELLMLHAIIGRAEGATDSRMVPFSASKSVTVAHGLDFSLDSASASLSEDTKPVPSLGAAAQPGVDLDLTAAPQNLIDFEVSGFSNAGNLNKSGS